MVVEASLMATKFGEDEDVEVELELCLSLGGPFKKTEKSKPTESSTDGQLFNGVNATRKKRERNQQQRNGEEGESKRFRTECNGVDLDLSFRKMGNGYGYGSGQIRSPICTSSEVSDLSNSSHQEGGSSEFGVNSGQTKPVNNIQTGTEETVQSTHGSHDAEVVKTQTWSNSVAREIRKPPKPLLNGNDNGNGILLPFAQMPCVTSTGNGPNGKTVNGFLYRYSKSEICIMCVCHGMSFSPAEFIVHAGGTNVSHPLRHITVVPSTF